MHPVPKRRGAELWDSLLNSVLQGLASLECGQLGSLDGDLGTGLGVAALALGALADLESAKANQGDLVAALQGLGDDIESAVDSSLGILLGQICFSATAAISSTFVMVCTSKIYQQKAAANAGRARSCYASCLTVGAWLR